MVSASGPLIVEDIETPPYPYDEEIVVYFQDYFNETDPTIEQGLVATPFVWSGETNAVLINGVGVSIGEIAGENGCSLPVINVDPGKTYRMRFIGATALSSVWYLFGCFCRYMLTDVRSGPAWNHRSRQLHHRRCRWSIYQTAHRKLYASCNRTAIRGHFHSKDSGRARWQD